MEFVQERASLVRAIYYFGLLALSILVVQSLVASLAGESVAALLRRNSEAYALMFLIPAYWEAIHVDRHGGRTSINKFYLWTGVLFTLSFVLQSDLGKNIPAGFKTLSEAFAAALLLSLYFAWSRSRAPFSRGLDPYADERKFRIVYYAVVGTIALIATFRFSRDLFGDTISRLLRLNGETFGAMLIIPLYFDFVRDFVRSKSPQTTNYRWAWFALLLGATIITRNLGAIDDADAGLFNQMAKVTGGAEPFLATIVISAYFDFIAPESLKPRRFHADRPAPET